MGGKYLLAGIDLRGSSLNRLKKTKIVKFK